MKRSDWQLIQYFEKRYGKEKAKEIQSLPYLEISQELADKRIIPFIQTETNKAAEKVELQRFALSHMPWSAFVMHFPTYFFPEGNYQVGGFLYVTGKVEENGAKRELMFCCNLPVENDTDLLAIISVNISANANWKVKEEVFFTHPRIKVLPIKNIDTPEAMRSFHIYAVACLSYLALCPERIVATRSNEPVNRQTRKRIAKDISERPDLTTHILIDPSQAPKYQPPALRAITEDLASKVSPHRRRAHWRRLPEKVVRVRESWIGTREWTNQGRAYKVVSPPGDREIDRD